MNIIYITFYMGPSFIGFPEMVQYVPETFAALPEPTIVSLYDGQAARVSSRVVCNGPWSACQLITCQWMGRLDAALY
jgi:hypothetical protein